MQEQGLEICAADDRTYRQTSRDVSRVQGQLLVVGNRLTRVLQVLEDVPGQVLVLDQLTDMFVHEISIHDCRLAGLVSGFERDGVEKTFHDGMQSSCPNVLCAFIDLKCDFGNTLYAVFAERQVVLFNRHQGTVLFSQ